MLSSLPCFYTFADLLPLHPITFLMLFILVHIIFVSSKCMLELKFATYDSAASLSSQASYAVLAEETLTRPGSLRTLPAHQLYFQFSNLV